MTTKHNQKREAVKASITANLKNRVAKAIAKHGTFSNLNVAAIQQRKIEKRRIYEEGKQVR